MKDNTEANIPGKSNGITAKKVVKTALYISFFPIFAPFIMLKKIVTRFFLVFKLILTQGPTIFLNAFKDMRKRVREEKERDHTHSFEEILSIWGIGTLGELNQKKRELIFHSFVWAIPLAFGVFHVSSNWGQVIPMLMGGLFFLPGISGCMTSLWKLHILQTQHFIHFTEWAFGYKRG